MLTEDDLRAAMTERVGPLLAPIQADDRELLVRLRKKKSHRRRASTATATIAAVAVIASASAAVLISGRNTPADVTSTESSVPLVSTGECAGLSLTATIGTRSIPVQPRAAGNTLTLTSDEDLAFKASGPCLDILVIGGRGNAFDSGPGGYFDSHPEGHGGAFSDGSVVLEPKAAGTETIWVQYACPGCIYIQDPNLATITVHVSDKNS